MREFEWAGKGGESEGCKFFGVRAYLRRRFSIARQTEVGGRTEIELLHRVVGKGTGGVGGVEGGGWGVGDWAIEGRGLSLGLIVEWSMRVWWGWCGDTADVLFGGAVGVGGFKGGDRVCGER